MAGYFSGNRIFSIIDIVPVTGRIVTAYLLPYFLLSVLPSKSSLTSYEFTFVHIIFSLYTIGHCTLHFMPITVLSAVQILIYEP